VLWASTAFASLMTVSPTHRPVWAQNGWPGIAANVRNCNVLRSRGPTISSVNSVQSEQKYTALQSDISCQFSFEQSSSIIIRYSGLNVASVRNGGSLKCMNSFLPRNRGFPGAASKPKRQREQRCNHTSLSTRHVFSSPSLCRAARRACVCRTYVIKCQHWS
jgi:hypothetical protein